MTDKQMVRNYETIVIQRAQCRKYLLKRIRETLREAGWHTYPGYAVSLSSIVKEKKWNLTDKAAIALQKICRGYGSEASDIGLAELVKEIL